MKGLPMKLHAKFLLALATVFASATPLASLAQNYPNKPIKVIVPFTPGGAIDQVIQQVGPKLTEAWGQPLIMDHRPGANGAIGAMAAVKSPADGYTLFMCSNASFSGNAALFPNLSYDPVKDFAAITVGTVFPSLLVIHPSVPANNVQELIAYARANPGKLNYASSGSGGSAHVAAESFNMMAGTKMTHVPYKGNSVALTDLVGGQVQLMFANVGPALPFVKSGRLKSLGVTSPARFSVTPDIPTVAEAGLPGFEMVPWIGFCAPAGTPREIVLKLNAEINKALRNPEVQKAFAATGAETAPMTTEQMDTFVKNDIAKWIQVVKAANIKPN